MSIFVVFGLPGAGKTYLGQIIEKKFGYYLYEADQDLPSEMERNLRFSIPIEDALRDEFFNRVIERTKELISRHERIVITQTFIKDKYRKLFLREFPIAKFIMIRADKNIRELRIQERKNKFANFEYLEKMSEIFEKPSIDYAEIYNNEEGSENLITQFKSLFKD